MPKACGECGQQFSGWGDVCPDCRKKGRSSIKLILIYNQDKYHHILIEYNYYFSVREVEGFFYIRICTYFFYAFCGLVCGRKSMIMHEIFSEKLTKMFVKCWRKH